MAERTAFEIAVLKGEWLADPCWGIEETEGFEAHRHELEAFALRHELKVRKRLELEAERLGMTPLARLESSDV